MGRTYRPRNRVDRRPRRRSTAAAAADRRPVSGSSDADFGDRHQYIPEVKVAPCWGGASGAPAATPSLAPGPAALSDSDGPAQAVRTPIVATPVIANVNHVRFNLHEIRLMPATLPLAVNSAHLRWQRRAYSALTGLLPFALRRYATRA